MKTIEEILTCVESCMAADICDDARHWYSYGDTDPSTCVDRLETDYQAILDVVKKVETLDRLTEICAAERDGRVCVLPCKVGDTVYWTDIDSGEVLELPLMGFWITVFSDGRKQIDGCVQAFCRNWSKPFGTCLFLTRAEAEAALAKQEGEQDG